MTCTIISNGFEKYLICKNEYEKPYPEMKRILRETIWDAYCNGYTDFYVNCEYGIPLWAAEIVCALKLYNTINLHIVTPYEEQATNWTEEQRDRYYSIFGKSDSDVMVCTRYQEDCYYIADETMIDKSDLVLVFGTNKVCYAEMYAKNMGVEVKRVTFKVNHQFF